MPRIAIPMPHSSNPEYAERAIPQYERAVELAGGQPVRIPLDQPPAQLTELIQTCDAVLLPGSNADVDPASFHAPRSPHTAAADPRRDEVDALLIADAYRGRKPVLGICYGLQSLNVHRNGSLIQHIPDFLPQETRAKVNHAAGRKEKVAHTVEIDPNCRLEEILRRDSRPRLPALSDLEQSEGESNGSGRAQFGSAGSREPESESRIPEAGCREPESGSRIVLPVNSSHHQSADSIGNGLRIVARCPDDGIIEALEGTSPDHFVLAVQWHPERSVDEDAASLAIFRALVEAARSGSEEKPRALATD